MTTSEAANPQDFFQADDQIFGTRTNSPKEQSFVPSSSMMLASLFLILIVFFTVIISHSELDMSKKNAVLTSVHKKFGQVEDENLKLGQIIPPKVDDITIRLLEIFGEDAKIETSIDGSKTTVTLRKESFFYNDEVGIRTEKYNQMIILQQFLKSQADEKFHITLLMGIDEYNKDKIRLANLKNILDYKGIDIGLTAEAAGSVKTVFENE